MGLFDWFKKKPPATDPPIPPHILAALEQTRRPFIRVDHDDAAVELPPTVSKLAGVPYVPVGATSPDPRRYVFIAQLNFAEVPRLDGMPLPEAGIVQFWVEDDNDTHGLYDASGAERTDGHRVVWYPDTDAPQAAGVPAHHGRGPLVGLRDPHGRRLHFALRSEVVPQDDHAWDAFEYREQLADHFDLDPDGNATGHKIGGYCAFTQGDPRDPNDPMLSLLQLDDEDICGWGDAGIAHWFIREADLRARNFANVRYYWDCC